MKRLFGITLGIIFFLFLAALIAWQVMSPTPSDENAVDFGTGVSFPQASFQPTGLTLDITTPKDTVESCYLGYLHLIFKADRATDDEPPFVYDCFTADFIASWDLNDVGANPVVLSETYEESWFDSIRVTEVYAQGDTSAYQVELGTQASAHVLLVQTVREGNGWKISAVRLP